MMEDQEHFNSPPKSTPLHSQPQRPFSNFASTPRPHHHISLTPAQDNYEEQERSIYGTNILIKKVLKTVENFLMNFTVTFEEEDDLITKRIYWQKLQDYKEADLEDGQGFTIQGNHLNQFSVELYSQLIYFPVEIITIFDSVLQQLYSKQIQKSEIETNTHDKKDRIIENLRVFIINLMPQDKIKIQDLCPKHIGKLVSISGLPIRISQIIPEMKEAVFQCSYCKQMIQIPLTNALVKEPSQCKHCRKKVTMILDHNSCRFTNKQYIKFQELLQNVAEGQSPVSVKILAYDSHADKLRCGDTIQIVGIYRCSPVKVQKNKNQYRTIFNTYFDLISFKTMEDKHQKIKSTIEGITQQDKLTFLKMANKSSIIDDLVGSFAPSIFGYEWVKKGILAQLMGGTKKDKTNTINNCRNNINVLLIGDPSTSKSQLLQHLHRIAPRSIYTCGRGSSASGLTVTVTRDPQTKEFILESGALVLGDQGICCIDQFDKMNQASRLSLLEAMEQQSISVAKAGIVCQLNSRTAILAAANPIDSKYNIRKSVIENIDLPPPLLTRFDLIYIMLDCPSESEDRKIAAHILDFYSGKRQMKDGKYDRELLSKYLSYARELRPLLNEEAGEKLVQQYKKRRQIGLNNRSISASPRMLESLIRISEAFAKLRLSTEATVQDVQQAIMMMNEATLKSATDPESGIIDMDIIMTGHTSSMRKKAQQISYKIKQLLFSNQKKYSTACNIEQLEEHLKKFNPKDIFQRQYVIEALQILQSQDVVYILGHNKEKSKFKLQQFDV